MSGPGTSDSIESYLFTVPSARTSVSEFCPTAKSCQVVGALA